MQDRFLGEGKGAGGNKGERNAFALFLDREPERLCVAGAQKRFLAAISAPPMRPDRVDDVFAGKCECGREDGVGDRETGRLLPTLEIKLLTCGAVDGGIDSAAVRKVRIGRVDDRVAFDFRNILADQLDRHTHSPFFEVDFIITPCKEGVKVLPSYKVKNACIL
jgi:hypothetical protein